jgi:hypothetical protein
MNEADTFLDAIEEQPITAVEPKKRERKAKTNDNACAEVVSKTVKLKLLRTCFINNEIKEPGSIIEVDELTAKEFLKPFDVQPSFVGSRYGKVERETIVRAERIN